MHDPRHQVSPKLLNFHEKKRERERERKKRQSVSFMKTDTGCRYSPRHLIISMRNIVEFPNFSNSLRPSLPEFARGSPLLLLFLLSTIHENDRHNAIEQKKKRFRSKIIREQVIKISAPFPILLSTTIFPFSLFSSPSLHTIVSPGRIFNDSTYFRANASNLFHLFSKRHTRLPFFIFFHSRPLQKRNEAKFDAHVSRDFV